jgi:hypothetical protein
MHVWIVLLALIMPTQPVADDEPGMSSDPPMRYRGIERLLAKFEAEQPPKAAQK